MKINSQDIERKIFEKLIEEYKERKESVDEVLKNAFETIIDDLVSKLEKLSVGSPTDGSQQEEQVEITTYQEEDVPPVKKVAVERRNVIVEEVDQVEPTEENMEVEEVKETRKSKRDSPEPKKVERKEVEVVTEVPRTEFNYDDESDSETTRQAPQESGSKKPEESVQDDPPVQSETKSSTTPKVRERFKKKEKKTPPKEPEKTKEIEELSVKKETNKEEREGLEKNEEPEEPEEEDMINDTSIEGGHVRSFADDAVEEEGAPKKKKVVEPRVCKICAELYKDNHIQLPVCMAHRKAMNEITEIYKKYYKLKKRKPKKKQQEQVAVEQEQEEE